MECLCYNQSQARSSHHRNQRQRTAFHRSNYFHFVLGYKLSYYEFKTALYPKISAEHCIQHTVHDKTSFPSVTTYHMTEHRRPTKNSDNKNNIGEHHLQTDHRIDWECISFSTDYYQQLTLESWFTNSTDANNYPHRTND